MVTQTTEMNGKQTSVYLEGYSIHFSYSTPIVIKLTANGEGSSIYVREAYVNYSYTTNRHMKNILWSNEPVYYLNEEDWERLAADPLRFEDSPEYEVEPYVWSHVNP